MMIHQPSARSVNYTLLLLFLTMIPGTAAAIGHINAALALLLIMGAFLTVSYLRIARKQNAVY